LKGETLTDRTVGTLVQTFVANVGTYSQKGDNLLLQSRSFVVSFNGGVR
jgi:hypothetical protein